MERYQKLGTECYIHGEQRCGVGGRFQQHHERQSFNPGAYINTGYTPASTDKAEFKFNMDNQVYSDADYRTIFAAGSGWQKTMHAAVNRDGWISNTRAGTIRFAAKGSNNSVTGFDRFADHVVKIVYQGDVDKFFTIDGKTEPYRTLKQGSVIYMR